MSCYTNQHHSKTARRSEGFSRQPTVYCGLNRAHKLSVIDYELLGRISRLRSYEI